MQPGVLGCSAAPLVSGAGRLMIFAGEGGRGLRGRFGRGEGGLWYGTTDFPHIFHVHPLIGIFVHKWKFCRKFGAERFTLLIVFNHATSEPSRTEVFIPIRNDNNVETFTWQQLRRALCQTSKQTNAKKKQQLQQWYSHLATVAASCVQHLCLTVHCCAYCYYPAPNLTILQCGRF